MNKQLILKVAALCLVCSIVTGVVVYAQTSTLQTIGLGPLNNASVTVFTDGSNYYAKTGYGEIISADTDATTVIQDAIDDTYGAGGIVFCMAGTYYITDTIELYSGITLMGEGFGYSGAAGTNILTRWYLDDAADCIMMEAAGEKAGSTYPYAIYNMYFVGNRDEQTSDYDLIDLQWGTDGVIEGCAFDDAGRFGLLIRNCRLSNCYFAGCGSSGVYSIADDIITENLFAANCIDSDYNEGQVAAHNAHDIISYNQVFESPLSYGINCYGAVSQQIIGNRIDGNYLTGIYLVNGGNHTVTSNHVFCNSAYGSGSYPGIYLNGAIDCVVSNNICNNEYTGYLDNYQAGIWETGAADYNMLIGNIVRGSVDGYILTVGAHTQAHLFYNDTTTWVS